MKYLFKRDTFFATIAVFFVVAILLHNPLNPHIFNPLKISLTDFALTDLAFSSSHIKSDADDRIVIVNIDTCGRKTIAEVLTHLAAYHPKVIGLDLLLPPREAPGNEELEKIITHDTTIVLCQNARYDEEKKEYTQSTNQFIREKTAHGFVNFVGIKGNVVRYFPPFLEDSQDTLESFTAAITRRYNAKAWQRLKDRKKEVEWINYQRPDSQYYTVRFSDILQDRVDSSFVNGKIVLVGYVAQSPFDIRDKHFTPLNEKLLGRSTPDMNGIAIHANILSMILDGQYITRVPDSLAILVAVILTWLHIAFITKYYIHRHLWFHLVVKTAEFVVSILLFYLSVLLLRYCNFNIDFTWTLIAIILAVDVFYFYETLTQWLTRKFGYTSIYNQTHNHP